MRLKKLSVLQEGYCSCAYRIVINQLQDKFLKQNRKKTQQIFNVEAETKEQKE